MKTQDTEQVDRTVGCFVNKLSARRQAKFSSSPSLSYDGRTRCPSIVGGTHHELSQLTARRAGLIPLWAAPSYVRSPWDLGGSWLKD